VVEPRKPQAVTEVLINGLRNRAGFTIAEELNEERIIGCRRKIGQVLIGIRPFVNDPEIELLDIPALCSGEVRRDHLDILDEDAILRRLKNVRAC